MSLEFILSLFLLYFPLGRLYANFLQADHAVASRSSLLGPKKNLGGFPHRVECRAKAVCSPSSCSR